MCGDQVALLERSWVWRARIPKVFAGFKNEMYDEAGRELRPELLVQNGSIAKLTEARDTLRTRITEHFSEQDVKGGRASPLSLTVGVYAGPWQWVWDAPVFNDEHSEKVRRRVLEQTRDAMFAAGTMSRDHWSIDAGVGWLGFGTPNKEDELRLYDDVPAVVAVSRRSERDAFSALWFVDTVLDAVQFAAVALPWAYPEIATATVLWRFQNSGGAMLRITDPVQNREYRQKAVSIFEGPNTWAWGTIMEGPAAIAQYEAKRFLDGVHLSYEVPRHQRPTVVDARSR